MIFWHQGYVGLQKSRNEPSPFEMDHILRRSQSWINDLTANVDRLYHVCIGVYMHLCLNKKLRRLWGIAINCDSAVSSKIHFDDCPTVLCKGRDISYRWKIRINNIVLGRRAFGGISILFTHNCLMSWHELLFYTLFIQEDPYAQTLCACWVIIINCI